MLDLVGFLQTESETFTRSERQLAKVEAFCDSEEGAFTEVHYERGYDAGHVSRLLTEAGFAHVEVSAHPDGGAITPETERLWVAART